MTEPITAQILLPDGTPMVFCRIPAGRFRMGSRGTTCLEEPVVEVLIPFPFWIGRTPVTQQQFAVGTRACGIWHSNGAGCLPESPNHPANCLDWRLANRFCHWLGTRVSLPEAMAADRVDLFCLPTSAEWEYACRAGTETEYHTGNGEESLAEAGWYKANAGGSTWPVGLKRSNAWGLLDTHGNVAEWCHDVYVDEVYRTLPDGGEDKGSMLRGRDWAGGLGSWLDANVTRVFRGGAWTSDAGQCRSGDRQCYPASSSGDWDVGFRVCLVRSPAGPAGARKTDREVAVLESEGLLPDRRLPFAGGEELGGA